MKRGLVFVLAVVCLVLPLSQAGALTGDVNGNQKVEMDDAILALQVSANIRDNITAELGDAVVALQVLAGKEQSGGDTLIHRIPDTGQDGEYSINPMSYTKLDAAGNDLPDSIGSWAMVRDNVTGLIWEMKENKDGVQDYSNPSDADNTYTWYDSDPETNGGDAGTDTEDFLKALWAKTGYSDWRLPTKEELRSIVDYSIPSPGPVVNMGYFLNMVSYHYWSSTAYANNTDLAWGVDFYGGGDYHGNKSGSRYVRAVRSGQGRSFDSLVISSDEKTVSDPQTGLMWEMKQNMDDTSVAGDPNDADNSYTWSEALDWMAELNAQAYAGYSDWRLPTVKELASLTDLSRYPAIPVLLENSTKLSYYWSSTIDATSTYSAWAVSFYYGGALDLKTSGSLYYVRAVRSGQ